MARMLYLRDIEVDVHVRCRACGHEGVLPRADMNRRFGPNYPVLSIAPHYRCSRCNSRDTESRPAPPPFSTPVTATSMVDDAPSFAGPLAALQGLLDAVRGRGDAMDEPKEDAAPVTRAPAPVPATARPAAALDPDLDLELERLAADSDAAPESGRRPLWEPVSLADLAGHDEDRDDEDGDDAAAAEWDDDEDWSPRRWTLADRDESGDGDGDDENRVETAPPATIPRASHPAAADDPDDDASRSFDRTIAALRSILDGRGDGARAEEAAPAPAPAFSIQDAAGVSQDDDALGEDPDDSDETEPSNDDILGFAIRDPDKAPPPWERPRERGTAPAGSEPLDRTIAALRSMVQKAAADRDEDEGKDDRDGGVVTPLFGRSHKPDGDLERDVEDGDGPEEDRKADADDAFWNGEGADDDADREGEPDDGAPVLRKSAQEQDMEEALRALRALVEAESDLDDPPHPAWKSEAPTRPDANALPGFKPLPRHAPEADDDDEPLDLVEPVPLNAAEKPKPDAGRRPDGNESGKKAAKDDSGTLGKTLAALRNMLELDGKQGR
ncbi:DNA-directed RNA polymerase subunit RPC12/RpoP [Azospirillum sp. OGB3]|uniref:hypothetical protein n=1 Tax=Azospirillum sp. OGB3 TaxID=2587012 RepID=UPI001606B739|nr:hypothetical protein [Azospirillum sp. OGB3]MBB3262757.1 DNA-directed RNA polymerase subunit RPC12/RpoP [Azospirillum sp. OGB3]